MEKPTKCYIRKEWFEAAQCLSPEDRCEFYEMLMSFIYYGSVKDTPPSQAKGMFEICKTSLENDLQRYGISCLRNRQNGSGGGRPRRDITPKNPLKPTETQKTHNIHIQLNNNSLPLNPPLKEITEVQRHSLILYEFFKMGVVSPLMETQRMEDYYTARGWKDKGGNPIIDPAACARVWKATQVSQYSINIRKKWCMFLATLGHPLPEDLITEFIRMEIKQECAFIFCKSKKLPEIVENTHLSALRAILSAWECKTIQYIITSAENAN